MPTPDSKKMFQLKEEGLSIIGMHELYGHSSSIEKSDDQKIHLQITSYTIHSLDFNVT